MKWNFVSACEKKIDLVRQFELGCFSSKITQVEDSNLIVLSGGGYEKLLRYLRARLEVLLRATRTGTSDPIWSLHTVIVFKRNYTQGGETFEKCIEIIRLWSGCSHTVYTLMGKMGAHDTGIKFRLSSSKVKFKRVTEGMIDLLAQALMISSKSGGYESRGILGQQIRHVAGPVGGCEGVPLFPLINFLN